MLEMLFLIFMKLWMKCLLEIEARGEKVDTNVILIHAQDHLMTTILYERIAKQMMRIMERGT